LVKDFANINALPTPDQGNNQATIRLDFTGAIQETNHIDFFACVS
jgi:hypothetical protein